MKQIFWIVLGTAFALTLAAILLIDVPTHPNVTINIIQDFYYVDAIICIVAGLLLGIGIGFWGRNLRHIPGESSMDFMQRAAGRAFLGLIYGLFLSFVIFVIHASMARGSELGNINTANRILLLFVHGRVFQPLGAGTSASGLALLLTYISRAWGGQFALTQKMA